jgi:hypothetical protein
MCTFSLNDMIMVIEKVAHSIHIHRFYLRLECQLGWLFHLLVRSHGFIGGHRLQHGRPLRDLRGLHVVLLHLLLHLHQVLLAFSGVGLATCHGKLHHSVGIVHEVELVLIWGDIYIVVHTTVESAHLVHAGVEIHVVATSECSVG